MNKILMGTTALVAAGILAGSAAAADKVKLGVGGYFHAQLIFASQDDGTGVDLTSGTVDDEPGANRRTHKVAREGEIHFSGSTTLDSGIQVGAQVQLEAETCGDQIDESFIWFSGSFGRFVIGSENSAAYLMMIRPGGTLFGLGFGDPTFRHFNIGNGVAGAGTNGAAGLGLVSFTSDSEKLTYFTPRLSGLQLGVFYTPDNCEENGGGIAACGGTYAGFQSDHGSGQQSEVVEIGANYTRKVGSLDVGLSGGWAAANAEATAAGATAANTEDRDAWSIGGRLGVSGVGVSATYVHDDMGSSVNNSDYTYFGLGASYALGPWTMGLEYGKFERGTGLVAGNDGLSAIELGAKYAFGPGITMGAGVQFIDLDDSRPTNTGQNQENDATVFILATSIGF